MLRVISFVAQFFMFWLPLGIGMLMLVFSIHQSSVGLGIFGALFVLVAGLCGALAMGAARGKK